MSASESVSSRLFAEAQGVADRVAPANLRSLVRPGIVALEVAVDYIMSSAAVLTAFWCNALVRGNDSPALYNLVLASLTCGFLIVLLLERQGTYQCHGSLLRIRETEQILRVVAQATSFLLAFGFLRDGRPHWGVAMFLLLFLPLMLIPQKLMLHTLLLARRAHKTGVHRAVVYGAGGAARRIISVLLQSHRLRILPVAMVDEIAASPRTSAVQMGYRRGRSIPVLDGPFKTGILRAFNCSLLIVVTRNLSGKQIALAEEAAERAGVRIARLSGGEFERPARVETIDLDGLSLVSATELSMSFLGSFVKRAIDLLGSAALLLSFAPLLALIAVAVRLESPGPALFVQQRVGRGGAIFSMYKFRSMYLDTPRYQRSPESASDPRITRIGRLLRRTSLDELPQLLNILLGEMSLVGPRPEMPFVVQRYNEYQRQRLQVMPGLTGLWQLSADRAFPIHEALEYDLYYIRKQGFFMDVAILIHTLFFAIGAGV